MKRPFIIPILLLAAGFLTLAGCDVIEDPLKENPDPPIENDTVYRRVLIEDFTGHRCKNCPKASKEIENIRDFFGNRVIALAIHAGPSQFVGTTTDYPTDFTTPEGDAIGNFFTISVMPIGMICRQDYTGSGVPHLKLYNSWPTLTNNLVGIPAIADMEVTAGIAGGNIETTVTTTFIGTQNGTYKIATFIKESGIVAPQLMPDDTRDTNYIHNNVMRKAVAGAFGEDLVTGEVTDSVLVRNYTTALDPLWNTSNLDVVSYIYDASSYEVMQVAEGKVN